MKKVLVTKYDASKQPFDEEKVLDSILRTGVERDQALDILETVKARIYEGIPTQELYQMVFQEIAKKRMPQHSRLYRLREVLAKMDPKDFEKFIKAILEKEGCDCRWNVIVEGFCVNHQADVVAYTKDGEIFFVEVERHRNFHRDCGLGKVVELWGRLEDLQKGYKTGKNKYNFAGAWLITNTKFSEHAKKYAACKGLHLTGWRYTHKESGKPYSKNGLEKKIESLGARTVDKIIKKVVG